MMLSVLFYKQRDLGIVRLFARLQWHLAASAKLNMAM